MADRPLPGERELAAAEIRRLFDAGYSRFEVGRRLGISAGQAWNISRGRTGAGALSIERVRSALALDESMPLLGPFGPERVQPANRQQRALLWDYWMAVQDAQGRVDKKGRRRPPDWSKLEKMRGKSITFIENGERRKLPLITDPKAIRDLERQDLLDPGVIGHASPPHI